MASETSFLRAIIPSLPNDFATKIRTLCGSSGPATEYTLDTLIRFISGAECAPNSTTDARAQWAEKQQAATKILSDMIQRPSSEMKRQREDDVDFESKSQTAKRQRLPASSEQGPSLPGSPPTQDGDVPLFVLHSISATSPIRKKVDITIHTSSIQFTHPSTHALEATVPLSALTRAFILPTRGKQKPHWTVIILSSDTPDRGKPAAASAQSNPQVIFGLDALATSPLTATAYTPASVPSVHLVDKGGATLPSIHDFLSHLSHLGVQVLEPTPAVFKSACVGAGTGVSAREDGVPGIEAYRRAKLGSLWFMEEGILWGESKPCEFWAVEDLIGKSEGLRVVSASGRTCSVILTRKNSEGDEGMGEDEEDVGVETEFGLVDARERSGIDAWVRTYRHLFGKKKGKDMVTIHQLEDDSDDEDEDFEMDSDEVGNESSSDTSDEEVKQSDKGSEEESEAEHSGGEDDDEEEDLNPANHPLMRPGAMPRMSRAAIDMVAGMVEEDLVGPAEGDDELESDDDGPEEDELED